MLLIEFMPDEWLGQTANKRHYPLPVVRFFLCLAPPFGWGIFFSMTRARNAPGFGAQYSETRQMFKAIQSQQQIALTRLSAGSSWRTTNTSGTAPQRKALSQQQARKVQIALPAHRGAAWYL
jgi:hypothetical protein